MPSEFRILERGTFSYLFFCSIFSSIHNRKHRQLTSLYTVYECVCDYRVPKSRNDIGCSLVPVSEAQRSFLKSLSFFFFSSSPIHSRRESSTASASDDGLYSILWWFAPSLVLCFSTTGLSFHSFYLVDISALYSPVCGS